LGTLLRNLGGDIPEIIGTRIAQDATIPPSHGGVVEELEALRQEPQIGAD